MTFLLLPGKLMCMTFVSFIFYQYYKIFEHKSSLKCVEGSAILQKNKTNKTKQQQQQQNQPSKLPQNMTILQDMATSLIYSRVAIECTCIQSIRME